MVNVTVLFGAGWKAIAVNNATCASVWLLDEKSDNHTSIIVDTMVQAVLIADAFNLQAKEKVGSGE